MCVCVREREISSLLMEMQLMSVKFFKTVFINRCLSIAEKINNTAVKGNSNPLYYLSQAFNSSFPNIKYKYTSTKETEKIMKSLKLKKIFTWL